MSEGRAHLHRLLANIESLANKTLLDRGAISKLPPPEDELAVLSLENYLPKSTEDLLAVAALAFREYVAQIRAAIPKGDIVTAVVAALEIGWVYAEYHGWKSEPETELGKTRKRQLQEFGRARWADTAPDRAHRDSIWVDLDQKLRDDPDYSAKYPTERKRAEYIAATWNRKHGTSYKSGTVRDAVRRTRKPLAE